MPYHRRGHRCDEPPQAACEKKPATHSTSLSKWPSSKPFSGSHSSTSTKQISMTTERNEQEEEEVCGVNADTLTPLMCRRDCQSTKRNNQRKEQAPAVSSAVPFIGKSISRPTFGRRLSLRKQAKGAFARRAMLRTRGFCHCPSRSMSTILNICPRVAKDDGTGRRKRWTLGRGEPRNALLPSQTRASREAAKLQCDARQIDGFFWASVSHSGGKATLGFPE